MTPTADSANATPLESVAPEKLLDEGEMILLAIKPSGWFVLLLSWPVLVVAAAVAGGVFVTGRVSSVHLPSEMIYIFCLGVICLRVAFAYAQWVSNLYILTNRRVLSVTGVGRVNINDCPLRRIRKTALSPVLGERLFGLANLLFEDAAGELMHITWVCLSRPSEVQEVVETAIHRANQN